MHSIVKDDQVTFEAFNLLKLPIAIFSGTEKALVYRNTCFEELISVCEPVSGEDVGKVLEQNMLIELECIYQRDTESHLFTIEVNSAREKHIHEYNAYRNRQFIIVHVQEVSKLKRTQYLLNSSSAMLEKYSQDMYSLAHTDQLTQTANRRALFNKFDELKATNSHLKCSISVLDIDFFKKFNDTYGHEFGDYVLEVFCSHIKKMITPLSFFARIGGEEFCLIQSQSDKTEGTSKVQEILESIKDMQLETSIEKTVNISFSAGVSEYGKDGTTLDVLLNNADKALYFAKQNGRSCVIPFSTELFEQRDEILYTKEVARKSR